MSNFDKLEKISIEVKGQEKPKPARDYLEQYYRTLGDGALELLGIKTGLAELDKKTLGLDGLIVLGGVAGAGKTSLALQLAFDACELGTPTIFYSLEMPRRAIFTKILNRLAEVKYSDILLKGRQYLDKTRQDKNVLNEEIDYYKLLTKQQAKNLKQAKERLTEVSDKFYIRSLESQEQDISFESVEKEINIIKATHKAEKILVVVDHLQVFKVVGYKDQIDKEGKLITGFKGISGRTEATILLISQKNKAGFTSEGLQTIKGSVDIVYLADVVMFLGNKDDNIIATYGQQKRIDLVIAKNRYNTPCTIKLDFNGAYSVFTTART